jgi:hypothetical protein
MTFSAARVRSGIFALTALFYALPFLTLSCPGGASTFTGVELAIGTDVEEPQMLGPPKSQHVDGEPLALAALACAVAGALIASMRGRVGRTGSIVLASVGGVLLLAIQHRVGTQVQEQGMGILSAKFELGYWLALLGYGLALLSALTARRVPATPKLPPLPVQEGGRS